MSSSLGGASFLMFTTLSTILVPINTGFTSSSPLSFGYPWPLVIPDFTTLVPPPFETTLLEGEQEVLFGTAFKLVSVIGNLTADRPGISGGFFDGLDLTDGEIPRDFIADETEGLDGREVGVEDLDADLETATIEGR
ncbi:hypothetical protein HanIR_Chr16g0805911 [Helianthus annuus]|nr:hypothetical protein HanIR_Chr16g0805911 [Helianthus annuus]